MLSKLTRGVSRLVLHVVRPMLTPLELLNSRMYMIVYLRILRTYGLKTTGEPRYIASDVKFDDMNMTTLGERCVISKRVILLTHDYSITTALLAIGETPGTDVALRREIVVGDNVFIGMGAILLPGTVIEDNVIIGGGSVVRGRIESNSIVVGNPAQRIGSITERSEYWRRASAGENAKFDSR